MLSSKHRRCTVRPSAAENRSCIGKPSPLSPVAIEIVSASGVEDAEELWRFDLHAKGHVRTLDRSRS